MSRYPKQIPMPLEEWQALTRYGHRIDAVKHLRWQTGLDLREILLLMAKEFGFETWQELWGWQAEHRVDFEMIKGPHALTMMRVLAIRYGRYNDTP